MPFAKYTNNALDMTQKKPAPFSSAKKKDRLKYC
jgi:hypothetical protein